MSGLHYCCRDLSIQWYMEPAHVQPNASSFPQDTRLFLPGDSSSSNCSNEVFLLGLVHPSLWNAESAEPCSSLTACPQCREVTTAICSDSAVPPGDSRDCTPSTQSPHTCHTPSCNIPDSTARLPPTTTQRPSPLLMPHPHKPQKMTLYVQGLCPPKFFAFLL